MGLELVCLAPSKGQQDWPILERYGDPMDGDYLKPCTSCPLWQPSPGVWDALTGVSPDLISADLTGVTGDLDDRDITDEDRIRGIHVNDLIV